MTERKLAIARDYYSNSLNLKQIAKKHKIKEPYINAIANEIDFNVFQNQEKDYRIIKVESKWLNGIIELMERMGIDYELHEKYELTEYYQSKINQ